MIQDAAEGGWHYSTEQSWSELAMLTELDPGFSVFLTTVPQQTLYLGLTGSAIVYQLSCPHPAHYFSFDRFATRLQGPLTHWERQEQGKDVETVIQQEAQIWLYSVFGYVLGDQIICLRYRPTQEMELLVLSRPVAFPW